MDYENEKKDYSGLKIESLKVGDKDDGDEVEHEINEETGEKIIVNKKDGNVWTKKKNGGGSPDESDEEDEDNDDDEKEEEDKGESKEKEEAPAKSSYVPPHMRGMNR